MNGDDSMRIKNEANFFMRKLDTFPALYQREIVEYEDIVKMARMWTSYDGMR